MAAALFLWVDLRGSTAVRCVARSCACRCWRATVPTWLMQPSPGTAARRSPCRVSVSDCRSRLGLDAGRDSSLDVCCSDAFGRVMTSWCLGKSAWLAVTCKHAVACPAACFPHSSIPSSSCILSGPADHTSLAAAWARCGTCLTRTRRAQFAHSQLSQLVETLFSLSGDGTGMV